MWKARQIVLFFSLLLIFDTLYGFYICPPRNLIINFPTCGQLQNRIDKNVQDDGKERSVHYTFVSSTIKCYSNKNEGAEEDSESILDKKKVGGKRSNKKDESSVEDIAKNKNKSQNKRRKSAKRGEEVVKVGRNTGIGIGIIREISRFNFDHYEYDEKTQKADKPISKYSYFSSASTNGNVKKKIYPAHTNIKTFTRYLEIQAWKYPNELEELRPVLLGIETACKGISTLVKRAMTDDLSGLSGDGNEINVQGETQKIMDVLANEMLIVSMCTPGGMDYVASEEEDVPTYCSTVLKNSAFKGKFAGVFDPLDGSANIGAGLPVGTIFGIYETSNDYSLQSEKVPSTMLSQGSQLLVSGYCLYGAQTKLVLSLGTGKGVAGFTLDTVSGQFILTDPDIRIPQKGRIYSINEGNANEWIPNSNETNAGEKIQDTKSLKLFLGNKKQRNEVDFAYTGALVADIHNVLMNGGIYGYPAEVDKNTGKKNNGKIRLLYESNPIAKLIEEAGGLGSTGYERILNIKPTSIHQRIPTYIGSTENIVELCEYFSSIEN